MSDCPHGVWRIRLVEEEPVVVEMRCWLCHELVWIGGEQGGITGQGQVVEIVD